MADDFTIAEIRETIEQRIEIIEGVREGYVNAQFRGGLKDAEIIQWLLDRLEKTEAERDTLHAKVFNYLEAKACAGGGSPPAYAAEQKAWLALAEHMQWLIPKKYKGT